MKDKMSITPMVVFLSLTFTASVLTFLWGMKIFSPTEIRQTVLPKARQDALHETLAKTSQGLNATELTGKKYYEKYCVVCHGEKGLGDGFNAFNLNPRPANLTLVKTLGGEYLFKVITKGSAGVGKSPLCPPWGNTLKEDDIRSLIAYLHTL